MKSTPSKRLLARLLKNSEKDRSLWSRLVWVLVTKAAPRVATRHARVRALHEMAMGGGEVLHVRYAGRRGQDTGIEHL